MAEEKKEVKAKAPAIKGGFKAKAGKYYCVKKCYTNLRIYRPGDVYNATEGQVLSNCFSTTKPVTE